ncbi:bifunctional phosphopantothenoylcysteine decarboxylase/phosphopantothenate--cysteine ligase CoaBC [Methanobacterium spitsbergense]|uniref:Coenzyme A biosynthesis bifunctional protein CoaBC n=1 Tax=Methanobacterium spitsbergense TaxID=2874285 RepID=A0A8T5ULV1_9EURY|nr:bifunctional phosphopantothenoylcysteine decarboxylase/phosphopantothenate--cysteine ligase CoaBC [Methanobacterium spitsbergense]MBZ2164852.1 bifunctional phosphopantothenoylcysteine decarboxylase/phosphopantothenate--cysteine ligase CoaBC [Methanobacterium spitsbergense]
MEIVVCVTGSIAAVESVKLVRELKRQGMNVTCFMSDDACKIIHPNAMEFATGKNVVLELTGDIEHVKYAQADLILVAPATANLISKFAYKIADNPISTLLITAYGYSTPIIFVPSMHDSMYKSVSENIERCKDDGIIFIDPKREEGKAKFPSIQDITLQTLRETSEGKLRGKKVVITAGGTYEEIDSVRGITNRSSGKMGLEIAKEAFIQGADVTLITGSIKVHVPKIFGRIKINSTAEMKKEIIKLIPESDVFVSAAAVSDFTVEKTSEKQDKISSKEDLTLYLKMAPKIINIIKEINPNIFLVGFKAEYNVSDEELISLAHKKMESSGADLMIANDVSIKGAGFGSDKNQVIIVDGDTFTVPLTSKTEIAKKIIQKIIMKLDN